MSRPRLIAFHLPQYHPFPENDEWWGKGFTEWTNVTKARPRFRGHYQPHLPTDMGFYDLRVPETRREQAKLARAYGIDGFCYYHYWFNGHLLMERPLEDMLRAPDFPFMLCWANENWTRAWDGGEKETLIAQKYDDYLRGGGVEHIRYLLRFFRSDRYIRIDNKPVIAIYRTPHIPCLEQLLTVWREEAAKEKMELYICRIESHHQVGKEYLTDGLNAAIEMSPTPTKSYRMKFRRYFFRRLLNKLFRVALKKNLFSVPSLKYNEYVDFQTRRKLPADYKYFPSVTPNFDNSARRENRGFIYWEDSAPELFERWLENVYQKFTPYSAEENLIFINAWNEWAEGNHLEPDRRYGRGYLQAVKNVVDKLRTDRVMDKTLK